MSWSRLIGFGEAMVRLTSPLGQPLSDARQLDVSVGGAELNALVAARWSGMPATWVTALPDGPLGLRVARDAAAGGVEVHRVASSGGRVGLYFLDANAPPRPSEVTYDRARSAFALLDPTGARWSQLLTAEDCLLITGITPALGEGPRTAMRAAVSAAADVGATVALDVNFRPSLWSAEECFALLAELVPHVSVLSAGELDLQALGVDGDDPFTSAVEQLDLDAAIGTRKSYRGEEVDIEVIATDRERQVSRRMSTTVVDPVGTGDALFGTFLAALPAHGLDGACDRALAAAVTVYGTAGDLMVGPAWDVEGPLGGVRR